jgi:hypothetical protein
MCMSDYLIKLLGRCMYEYDGWNHFNLGISLPPFSPLDNHYTIRELSDYDYYFYYHSIDDMFNLLRVCKEILKLLAKKLMKIVEFDISILNKLSTNQKKYLRYLFLDEDIYCKGKQRSLIQTMPSNIVGLTFSGGRKLQTFGNTTNQYKLPDNLTRLHFGYSFDSSLTKAMIPRKLQYLDLGQNFNQIISPGIFPETLTSLKFSCYYNQPIYLRNYDKSHVTRLLPNTLTFLDFGEKFNQSLHIIDNDCTIISLLPKQLTQLIIGRDFKEEINEHVFPSSLKHLEFRGRLFQPLEKGILPINLTYLHFGYNFGYDFDEPLEVGILPGKLKKLIFDRYNHPLKPNVLPKSLTYLDLSYYFNQSLGAGMLPEKLEYLKVYRYLDPPDFLHKKDIILPKSLKEYPFGHFHVPRFPLISYKSFPLIKYIPRFPLIGYKSLPLLDYKIN